MPVSCDSWYFYTFTAVTDLVQHIKQNNVLSETTIIFLIQFKG